jgi:phosphoesterase RecJ-like protein
MQPVSALREFFSTPRKIFLTMHSKPDGDALGSALALYHYFLAKGHTPVVVSPTDYGVYLHWMPGNPATMVFTENKEKVQQELETSDIIFCLDFNHLHRVDDLEEPLTKAKQPKVMIDHHLNPGDFDSYRLWNPNACATAELVFEFIEKMGDVALLDKNIATCLYTGLVTDSGSFRFPNVTPRVHRIVADLLEAGVDHTMVHRNIFDTFTATRLKFFGYCISKKLVLLPEYRAAYIYISKEEFQEYNIQTGETEGLVSYPLSLTEVVFAALITERDGIIKLSLRSKGSFPANEFSSKYFEGGGHLNAAGGSFKGTMEDCVKIFEAGLEDYKSLLYTV